MKRRVTVRTLENKLKKWQQVLKLSDWAISIKFVPESKLDIRKQEEVCGMVSECSPDEKVAIIYINQKYPQLSGFNISWNLDTLIIHELIHVLLWHKTDEMPERIQGHMRVKDFEEFVCNSLAKIIFDCSEN